MVSDSQDNTIINKSNYQTYRHEDPLVTDNAYKVNHTSVNIVPDRLPVADDYKQWTPDSTSSIPNNVLTDHLPESADFYENINREKEEQRNVGKIPENYNETTNAAIISPPVSTFFDDDILDIG